MHPTPFVLYVTASAEVRAHRRWLEVGGDPAQVLAEVQERDARDMGRDDAPLHPAGDATILDTSSLSVEQAIAEATALIGTALARRFGPAEVIFHRRNAMSMTGRNRPIWRFIPALRRFWPAMAGCRASWRAARGTPDRATMGRAQSRVTVICI